jgi:hypothetical protein
MTPFVENRKGIARAGLLGAFLVSVSCPATAGGQYIEPVCPAWQEVEGNGCRTRPTVFVAGAVACGVPAIGLLALVLVGPRGRGGRGEQD